MKIKRLTPQPKPTPKQLAMIGPRALKDPDSVEFAWQHTEWLKLLWQSKMLSLKEWDDALNEAEQHRIYEKIPPEKPYGSLDALLEREIGTTRAGSNKKLGKQGAPKGNKNNVNGGNRFKKKIDKGYNVTFVYNKPSKRGNRGEYLLSQLERDHPDIYKRYLNNEFPSVRAACIFAGSIKPKPNITLDGVEKTAKKIIDKMGKEYAKELAVALLRD